MGSIKVAINGFGTIGKRVADAIDAQEDMEVSGVTKTGPSFGCELAIKKGFPLYCTFDDDDRISQFSKKGYSCAGGLSDLLAISDVVVDCSPGKLGAENLEKYQSAGIKYIFQGGEKHELTGLSYTSSANHLENLNAIGTRVVSCNTTGLSRTLVPLFEHCGSLKVECTMIRRAADPGDSGKGPINAIKPVLKVPSHHGPDVMTVKPEIEINSLAVAVPTTIMHVHSIIADLPKGHGLDTDSILRMWTDTPRVIIMNGLEDRIARNPICFFRTSLTSPASVARVNSASTKGCAPNSCGHQSWGRGIRTVHSTRFSPAAKGCRCLWSIPRIFVLKIVKQGFDVSTTARTDKVATVGLASTHTALKCRKATGPVERKRTGCQIPPRFKSLL